MERASTQLWNPDPHGVAMIGEEAFALMYGAEIDVRLFRRNDGNIDMELLVRMRSGVEKWLKIDVKAANIPKWLPVNIRIIQRDRIYVMCKHYANEGVGPGLLGTAVPIGWNWGYVIMTYPIAYRWLENEASVHLIPRGHLRSMDDLKRAYHGRWRWNDVPDHPLKHPPEGYPARYR